MQRARVDPVTRSDEKATALHAHQAGCGLDPPTLFRVTVIVETGVSAVRIAEVNGESLRMIALAPA